MNSVHFKKFRHTLLLLITYCSIYVACARYSCHHSSAKCQFLQTRCLRDGNLATMTNVKCYGNRPVPVCRTYRQNCQGSKRVTGFKNRGRRRQLRNYYRPMASVSRGRGTGQNCIDLERLRREALEASNQFRQKHGVSPLTHSRQMEDMAQKYADQLMRQFTSAAAVRHSGGQYGENMALYQAGPGDVSKVTGQDVVKRWYDEIKNYDFARSDWRNGDRSKKIGHFTQLVWKNTREVGHGFATNSDCSKMFSVANYNPKGNSLDRLRENILPPRRY